MAEEEMHVNKYYVPYFALTSGGLKTLMHLITLVKKNFQYRNDWNLQSIKANIQRIKWEGNKQNNKDNTDNTVSRDISWCQH